MILCGARMEGVKDGLEAINRRHRERLLPRTVPRVVWQCVPARLTEGVRRHRATAPCAPRGAGEKSVEF